MSLGTNVFRGCNSLTSVVIPDSVTIIGGGLFLDCKNLTTVSIGSGVKFIDSLFLSGCDKISSVTFKDTNGWWYSEVATDTQGPAVPAQVFSSPQYTAIYLSTSYLNFYLRKN
jgi:hypothetical protein